MQLGTTPTFTPGETTMQHQSLYSLASEALHNAEIIRKAAFDRWQADRSHVNYEAFLAADQSFKNIERQRNQIHLQSKYSKNTDRQ